MKLASVRRALAAVVTASLVAVPLAVSAPADAGKAGRPGHPLGKPVTVMTRNIYLGADIQRPVNAALAAQARGGTPQQILVALANATYVTRAIVDQTDFTVRAGLLADEIAATEPDLIGLQEVAWWRHGVLELGNVGDPNATETDYDFLEMLLDELDALGVEYVPVSIAPRADVEAPSFTGSPFDATMGADARDVRLTMRDVVLMHVEDGLSVSDEGQDVFAHNLQVPLLGQTISFDRGYQWVDVRSGAKRFRFVNSHFEAFSSDLAFAQAAELLDEAVAEGRTTIFVCDCNSDPLNSTIKGPPVNDTLPHKAAYELITGTGEYPGESDFTDEWLEWAPAEEGWTSGLSETVDDADGDDFDHRIDMVFARTAAGDALTVDLGLVTGTDESAKDPDTGLWPSDHGGVVLRLRGL
jgi:endonuclease/exonuclease/phosphatase family metal-dependent hydrolase